MYIDIEAAGCTNTCRHCSVDGHLPFGQLFTLDELRLLRSEWGPLTIRYEPTAHPDFPEVCAGDIAIDHGGWLVSNGFGIARRHNHAALLERMHRMGMDTVSFTLHGLREHHDWFVCRQGAFDDILVATRRVRKAGFRPVWQVFVDRHCLPELPDLVALGLRECGEAPGLSLPYHRVGGRLWHYESLRPSLTDILDARLHERIPDQEKNGVHAPETLTASAWLQKWSSTSDAASFRHPFEPPAWPPCADFEHLSLRIRRDRKVFLDPLAGPPILLGDISESRQVILRRLETLSRPPCFDIRPEQVDFTPDELGQLHPGGASVRYLAISKARRKHSL